MNCAYCNFFPRHHKLLNNLGTFQSKSFPISLCSLPRVQGRGAQSPWLKETLTHRNTPCHLHLLLLSPVLPSTLSTLHTLPLHLQSFLLVPPCPLNHCLYTLICFSLNCLPFLSYYTTVLVLSFSFVPLIVYVLSSSGIVHISTILASVVFP